MLCQFLLYSEVEFPVLYGRFSLVIYFIHISAYMSGLFHNFSWGVHHHNHHDLLLPSVECCYLTHVFTLLSLGPHLMECIILQYFPEKKDAWEVNTLRSYVSGHLYRILTFDGGLVGYRIQLPLTILESCFLTCSLPPSVAVDRTGTTLIFWP